MKKFLKIVGWSALVMLVLFGIFLGMLHEARPLGTPSPEADLMAEKMMASVNKEAWDATRFIQFTYAEKRHYLWDKMTGQLEVKWEDKRVLLDIENQLAVIWEKGALSQNQEIKNKAWAFFCNDSFWLNAIVKAFDQGTSRSIVQLEDGRKGLLVRYSDGGVTPGDTYLWFLDENFRPTSWKMWVSIIPIGGLEVGWGNYQSTTTGALIAIDRAGSILKRSMENVAGENSLEAMGIDPNLFEPLNAILP